jgi:excisionase family DNA binding protein
MDEQLLGVREAARVLGMTEGAVRKAQQRGHLPIVRIGRSVRFRLSDIIKGASR